MPLRARWLLAPPEPLAAARERPLLGGRELQLLSGPERIEAGWWDHELAERDYFIAGRPAALVWLYRSRLRQAVPAAAGSCTAASPEQDQRRTGNAASSTNARCRQQQQHDAPEGLLR